jgi:hypothetical protein
MAQGLGDRRDVFFNLSSRRNAQKLSVCPQRSWGRLRKEVRVAALSKSSPALLLGIVLTFSGCSRYEMKEDKEGRTARIDHWTGEVTIIAGDHMIKVKTQEEQDAEDKKRAASVAVLSAPKSLPPVPLEPLGGGAAMLQTSWRDGKMFYQFRIRPLSKRVEHARNSYGNSFDLALYDNAGFKLKEIKVFLTSMVGNVDDSGKLQGLSIEDSEFCSEDDYRHIATWNVSWYGFGPS